MNGPRILVDHYSGEGPWPDSSEKSERAVLDIEVFEEGRDRPGHTTLPLTPNPGYEEVRISVNNVLKELGTNGTCLGEVVVLDGLHSPKEFKVAMGEDLDEALEEFHHGDYLTITFKATYSRLLEEARGMQGKLYDAIHDEKIQNSEDKWFVPNDKILQIFTEDAIKALFEEFEELKCELPRVPEIRQRGSRLLATLILAGLDKELGRIIKWFLNHGKLDDARMPFVGTTPFWSCSVQQYHNICLFQWQVLAVELAPLPTGGEISRKIEYGSERVLPFVEKKQVGSGGFGKVYKVKIAASHQKLYRLPNDSNPYLALKEADRDKRMEDWTKERKMLNQLQEFGHHKHLPRLLSSFQHGEKYYLLFPFARSDLHKHFQSVDPRGETQSNRAIWVLEQLEGLTDGLSHIHDNSGDSLQTKNLLEKPVAVRIGYHHDLKPENLLLFDEMENGPDEALQGLEKEFGRIIISDFGLGKFRDLIDGSATRTIQGSEVYAAPEAGPRSLAPKQARAYDIWSFGCIILEFIVWLKDGPAGLEAFARSRSGPLDERQKGIVTSGYYYYDETGKAHVRRDVVKRIEYLKQHCNHQDSTGPIRKLLELVETCLQINPNIRPKATEVAHQLKSIASIAKSLSKEKFFRDDSFTDSQT